MRIQNIRALKKMKISTKREKKKIKLLAIAQLGGWELKDQETTVRIKIQLLLSFYIGL